MHDCHGFAPPFTLLYRSCLCIISPLVCRPGVSETVHICEDFRLQIELYRLLCVTLINDLTMANLGVLIPNPVMLSVPRVVDELDAPQIIRE